MRFLALLLLPIAAIVLQSCISPRAATGRQAAHQIPAEYWSGAQPAPGGVRLARSLDDAAFLPWPPPAPTRMGDVSERFMTSGALGKIDSQIRRRLASRGYDRLHYFAVPGGFAVTTNLERIDDKGAPAADRWVAGKTGGWSNLFHYVSALIRGERGRFRLFAIVVTDEDVEPAPFDATQQDLSRWRISGRPYLSSRRASLRARPGTRVWLLVYEFVSDRSKGGTVVADREGRFSFWVHARSLGL